MAADIVTWRLHKKGVSRRAPRASSPPLPPKKASAPPKAVQRTATHVEAQPQNLALRIALFTAEEDAKVLVARSRADTMAADIVTWRLHKKGVNLLGGRRAPRASSPPLPPKKAAAPSKAVQRTATHVEAQPQNLALRIALFTAEEDAKALVARSRADTMAADIVTWRLHKKGVNLLGGRRAPRASSPPLPPKKAAAPSKAVQRTATHVEPQPQNLALRIARADTHGR